MTYVGSLPCSGKEFMGNKCSGMHTRIRPSSLEPRHVSGHQQVPDPYMFYVPARLGHLSVPFSRHFSSAHRVPNHARHRARGRGAGAALLSPCLSSLSPAH